jgi:hypothetical protein
MRHPSYFSRINKKQQINELATSKHGTSVAPVNGKIGHLEGRRLDGVAEGPVPSELDRVPQNKTDRFGQNNRRKYAMKKYVKPSLTSLGLLRVVTQFSCEPVYTQRSY